MVTRAKILHESPLLLWGMSSRERLERMLGKAGIPGFTAEETVIAATDSVLLLRGDFLYDQRIIQNLIGTVGIVLETSAPSGPRQVAAHVPAALAERMCELLNAGVPSDYPEDLRRETPASLVPVYLKELRKFDVPYLYPITIHNRRSLERRLFDGSYKGVTDLVTKWLWPTPARWVTGFCARHGIVPNQVTSASLVLSVLAVPLFYYGFYATGLVLAWLMTFFDTVDGKLARVTLNYSTFGNLFDHIIDLIFPPIWYVVWALSLPGIPGIATDTAIWMILAGYVVGRMVELVFKQGLESSGIFCWQPIDSCFRLITGRRNPNLLLLTGSLCVGRPDLGLLAVCLWTVLSSLFLVVRLVMGIRARIKTGPLRSWFLDVDPVNDHLTFWQRWFYRHSKVESGADE